MPPTTRSTAVTSDGAHLAVYTDGDPDAPVTVVLAHGFLESADAWRVQTRRLAALGHRVVRYDQRAHGNSTAGDAPTTLQCLGADLGHIITAAAPTGPLVLAGHSMGGMSIMALAARQPHVLVDRRPHVALVSTACTKATFAPGRGPLHWAKAVSRAAYAYPICWMPATADRLRRRLPATHLWALSPHSAHDQNVPPPCREAIHHTPAAPIVELWRSLRAYDTTGALHELDSLGHRVEILTGACDDMIPMAKTRELARQLPHALLHEAVPGARHRLLTDRHGRTAVTETLTRMCNASRPAHAADLLAG
ncbi:alpha/beta fold hydrolase [Streptomyces mirabilis]|uniref:alpha/beta fold hydrolase n=1 Tax=Streptomyces mirabilis TaxID=68239 RepID=UPI0033E787FA